MIKAAPFQFTLLTLVLVFSGLACAQSQEDDDIARLINQGQKGIQNLGSAGRTEICAPKPRNTQDLDAIYPTANIQATNGQKIEVSIVPESELPKLFKLAGTLGLPWRNKDLCADRAHVMASTFDKEAHVIAGKLMLVPKNEALIFPGMLKMHFKDGSEASWKYHVAPFVIVEKNGKQEQWVIDPSTSTSPIRRDQWEKQQGNAWGSYVTNRFAMTPQDRHSTDMNDYTGRSNVAQSQQRIDENRGHNNR